MENIYCKWSLFWGVQDKYFWQSIKQAQSQKAKEPQNASQISHNYMLIQYLDVFYNI